MSPGGAAGPEPGPRSQGPFLTAALDRDHLMPEEAAKLPDVAGIHGAGGGCAKEGVREWVGLGQRKGRWKVSAD